MHLFLIFGGIALALISFAVIVFNLVRARRIVLNQSTPFNSFHDDAGKFFKHGITHLIAAFSLSVGILSTLAGFVWYLLLIK